MALPSDGETERLPPKGGLFLVIVNDEEADTALAEYFASKVNVY